MQLTDSQRYCTPQEILDLVAEFWPAGIVMDPCSDPESLVIAKHKLDPRAGHDGLIEPWRGRCFVNPPYDQTGRWLLKALQHASAKPTNEVLCLVNAAVGSDYWREYVWPHAAALACLSPRVKFYCVAKQKWSPNPVDSAMVYYGPNRARFAEVFGKRGVIVTAAPSIKPAA